MSTFEDRPAPDVRATASVPAEGFPILRTIAVTGGAGFLGSHLCEALIGQGHTVVCLDNFHTGRERNIHGLTASGRFHHVRHDVTEPLPENLPRFDEIYNLACPASPRHYQEDSVRTAMVCTLGAFNMLERARRDGARLLQASTSEVYGDPSVHPQIETYWGNVNPVGPRSCYDEGKRFAETLCTDYARQNRLVVKIVRIFNTYGPRMQPDDGRVVSNFVIQALEGADLTIYGDGSQTRSFCYVDDMINGFLSLMRSGEEVSGPVNIGNPTESTVAQLAEAVIALTGSASRVVRRKLPIDDPQRRRPDIGRARTLLGWQPEVELNAGLLRTIQHFADELGRDQRVLRPTIGLAA